MQRPQRSAHRPPGPVGVRADEDFEGGDVLYTTAISYDPARVPPERAQAHVRAVAELVFPESDGFDHASLHPFMPGREQTLPNRQTFCFVKVDCRGPDSA